MEMTEKLCGKPAVFSYVWNGEVHYSCEEHCRKLQALCMHMGWPLTVSLIDGKLHKCKSVVKEEDETK